MWVKTSGNDPMKGKNMYSKSKLTAGIAAAAVLGLGSVSFAQAGGNLGAAGTGTTNNAVGKTGMGTGTAGTATMKATGKTRHAKKSKHSKKKYHVTPGGNAGNGPGFSGAAGTGAPGVNRM